MFELPSQMLRIFYGGRSPNILANNCILLSKLKRCIIHEDAVQTVAKSLPTTKQFCLQALYLLHPLMPMDHSNSIVQCIADTLLNHHSYNS